MCMVLVRYGISRTHTVKTMRGHKNDVQCILGLIVGAVHTSFFFLCERVETVTYFKILKIKYTN